MSSRIATTPPASVVKPDPPPAARELLSRLLDRLERPNRQTVIRVRLKEIKSYASGARAEIHAALAELARQNVIALYWVKHEENNWLEAVDLLPAQAGVVYHLLQRAPRTTREQALRELLDAHQPHGEPSEWYAAFLQWAAQQIDAHRSVAPLDLDDPHTNADLLSALAVIADLQSPVLERALSVRVFGDSKRLEALRGNIITVLRRHNAAKAAFIDDDDALLRAHLLERAPEYVPISGPLILRSGASEVDVGVFAPSVGLSAAMLRQSGIARVAAQHVVTVENATSFSELCTVRPESTVLVFTGGFASPTVIHLLQTMHAARSSLQFWHWGDLDVGGLRILAHLRQHVETIRSVGMDAQTFERHRAFARPLKKSERDGLLALQSMSLLSDCVSLMDAMLAAGLKLEQEAIRPESIIGQVS